MAMEAAEGEIKTSVDEVKENVEGQIEEGKADLDRVLEAGPPALDSVVKPLEEEVTQATRSLVENLSKSYSHVNEVGKDVEKLVPPVSDTLSSLKNLGEKFYKQTPESSPKDTEDTLPTSDKNVGESSEAAKNVSDETVDESKQAEKDGLDENPRSTHTQPFIALSASDRASWMNCCGLLDVLKRSDQ